MKIFKLLIAIAVCGFMTTSWSNEQIDSSVDDSSLASRNNGNYAPTGKHYNLNIIGMSKGKTADMTGDNGHRIFVKLWGKTKIKLIEGDNFAVLDANGTDNNGASFQMPNPDLDGDGYSSYSIWLRALGKPGGSTIITTCADADLTDDYYEVCSAEYLVVGSQKGPAKFENVTRTLLTVLVEENICVDEDGDGECEIFISSGRYSIFDDTFENYFWEYDNRGLKLLQLRFYEMKQDIS